MISAITLVEKMPRPTYLETLTSARMSCEEYHLSTYVSRNQELNAIEIPPNAQKQEQNTGGRQGQCLGHKLEVKLPCAFVCTIQQHNRANRNLFLFARPRWIAIDCHCREQDCQSRPLSTFFFHSFLTRIV